MNTFKNVQVAHDYNVSSTAVLRWIEGSVKSKNSLQLQKTRNKLKILDSEHNVAELMRLSEQSVIYKNKILYSEVTPKPALYEILRPEQIIEIVNFLETKRVIPHKFEYIGEGSRLWDEFLKDTTGGGGYPYPKIESNILLEIFPFIKAETRLANKLNLIDVACGNVFPTLDILKKLTEEGKLNKYLGIDISKDMVMIAKANLKNILPEIRSEFAECDIENENPAQLFFRDRSNINGVTSNVVLFMGGTYGTIENRSKALGNLRAGMGKDDYLIFSNQLEKVKNRIIGEHPTAMKNLMTWIPRLLNISVDECTLASRYNEIEGRRQTVLKLDKDYSIDFEVFGTTRRINLYKGEEIVLWSHKMSSVHDIIKDAEVAGFKIALLSVHEEKSMITLVCKTNDTISA